MLEIKLGDIVERVVTIKGSNLPPVKEIVCIDEEMLQSFEMLKEAPEDVKEIFKYLDIDYKKIWRLQGKDYILIWEEKDESRNY